MDMMPDASRSSTFSVRILGNKLTLIRRQLRIAVIVEFTKHRVGTLTAGFHVGGRGLAQDSQLFFYSTCDLCVAN